ncbi:MAG TPA: hypothetical protein VMN39_06645 [Longimicrobiaceae bacterium]|nr:hypothetical protein [Longimicrobiaceae bacterium]
MKRPGFLLLLFLLAAPAAHGQSSLEAVCGRTEVRAVNAVDECLAAVQAALSAQPALGLVIAGGNPTLGTAGAAGLRLGVIPRTSAGIRLNLVGVRLPGILAEEIPGRIGEVTGRFGAPVPAILGDFSIALTEGLGVAPGLGGIGAISLLGSASYLPFRHLGIDGFDDAPDVAWGIGARVHILQESFVVPGVSVSLMRRQLATLQFGDVCVGIQPGEANGVGTCAGSGDPGEVRFNLVDWSARAVASKHLLGFGLTAGLGYDRYGSDLAFGFRAPEPVPGTSITPIFRVLDEALESSRWTVFGNASYTLIFGTIGVEAGWQQGTSPITGFRDIGSDFDPKSGIWFGSAGVRLSL